MSRKYRSLVFIIGIMLVLSVSAAAQAQADVSVRMVYWTGPESIAMGEVVNQYNAAKAKEDGIYVEMVLFGREGFTERQEALMAAQSPEVDIFYIATFNVGKYQSVLEPMNSYVPNVGEKGIFIKALQDGLTINGDVLGIPTDTSIHFLYYRKDLIDQLLSDAAWQARYKEISMAQLGKEMTPKPPDEWTAEDFHAAALFFTKSINPDSPTEYGTVLQAKNLLYNIMVWNSLLWGMGGTWFDDSGNINFDTPEFRSAAQLYADIQSAGASPAEATSYEYPEANQAFMSGQVAFMLQWSAAFPEVDGPSSSVSGQVGLAPIPGNPHATHADATGIGLSKFSQKKEAAAKWLAYLGTEEAMTTYAQAGGVPPVASVLEGMGDQRAHLPVVADHLEKYGFVETTREEAPAIYDVLSKNLSAVWAGQMDVETATTDSQAAAKEILGQ
jgi:multiple sugar transport system substrate-binding protein